MTVREPRRVSVRVHIRDTRREGNAEKRPERDVPKPVKDATEKFIKKYSRTLRDLENY